MIVFIAITALLTLLVVAWVVRPLLRPAPPAGVSSQRLNAAIYRDQLQALERDLARGAIQAADYEATRDELQLRLLDDTQELAPVRPMPGHTFWSSRRTAAAIALLLPLGAIGTYWMLGTPAAIEPLARQVAADGSIEQMVESLAARLKANPDNPRGWAMLARSYKVMGRLGDAEQALLNIGPMVHTDPDLLLEYADLLAVRANNTIDGRSLELVNKALALSPQHPMGLSMAGVAAYQRGDYAAAVVQWQKLLAVLEPGSPDALQVAADIAEARTRAGLPAVTRGPASRPAGTAAAGLPSVEAGAAEGAMTPEKINQMVQRLAERLQAKPDDLAGWARLARAYKVQGRLVEAEQAFAKAGRMVEGDPDLLTQYADLLAVRTGSLEGRPLLLVDKALALDPRHPMALMMAGSAAFRRADYARAIGHWERALAVLEPGSSNAMLVRSQLAEARAQGGLPSQRPARP